MSQPNSASALPHFDTAKYFYGWSKANLERGKNDVTRSHPKSKGLTALMLEDATEHYDQVPDYGSLTLKQKISLGSIAGQQRINALRLTKKKPGSSGMAKELVAGIYLKKDAQERYDNFMNNFFQTAEQQEEEKKKRKQLRQKFNAKKKAAKEEVKKKKHNETSLFGHEDTPDFDDSPTNQSD